MDLDVYDVRLHGSIDEFLVDKILTRRKCTSFMARIYDPFSKIEPVKLRLKNDIRKLIYENPSWDEPLSSAMFARWTENFKIVQDCRDGSENCSDIGTRPDSVSAASVMPGSTWLKGKEWMEKPCDDIVAEGIIKSVHKIRLSNDKKKVLKEGIIYDQFESDDYNVGLMRINALDVKKIAEREAYSKYIFPPMKRRYF